MYARGEIPCRLNHGSVKHKLSWTTPPSQLSYPTLLPVFLAGLLETQHPYTLLVRSGLHDLLTDPAASTRVPPILISVIPPLRAALGSSRDAGTFGAALEVVRDLAACVGPALVPFLHLLVPPIAARALNGQWAEKVGEVLRSVETEAGPSALKVLRLHCPTYSSVFHG
ncbi:hypothetical protein HKX48_007639 [Thoreauomyces humboldtii]|nr:hypothetical protein HKX48_007639 [Thoreauomyces humboldtii]